MFLTNDQNSGKSEGSNDSRAYLLMLIMGILIISILIAGIYLAFHFNNFAFVPYSVVITGIVAFFTVIKISRALSNSENEMRKAITVAIMVVYLGLLPTLAFQGILQFQVTGNASTASDVAIINQTANQTVLQLTPKDVSLSETVVTSFTTLVAAVLLFYFGAGAFDSYIQNKGGSSSGSTTTTPKEVVPEEAAAAEAEADPTATEKETTVFKYDSEGNCVEKTVTTERIKKIE